MKVWGDVGMGGEDEAGAGELWPIDLWTGELLLEELLMAINKGETLIGESVTECTGKGGKGLGEFELLRKSWAGIS